MLRTTRIAIRIGLGGFFMLALLAPVHAGPQTDAVLYWNETAGRAAMAGCLSPAGNNIAEGRMYAMTHAAIHDTVNAIERRYRSYAYHDDAIVRVSSSAAIAAAARDVMVSVIGRLRESGACIQDATNVVEAAYMATLAAIPNGSPKALGIALGQAAADAILLRREHDGSDQVVADFTYPSSTEPGQYRYPPGAPFAFLPKWGSVTPFALRHHRQFWPGPPYALRSSRYAMDFNEVKAIGRVDSTTRTPEQTEIGLFWNESSPLMWNRIARTVAAQKGLSVHENARLFALLNLAMADGYIASWEVKYVYNFWRPETAIISADTDGNPATEPDAGWAPLQPTYPIPDHVSGHANQGGVAAEVLRRFFGTDQMLFTACSRSLPPPRECTGATPKYRSYTSFSQAEGENTLSRIYIGIHFRLAVEAGVDHGRKIGRYTVEHHLRRLRGHDGKHNYNSEHGKDADVH